MRLVMAGAMLGIFAAFTLAGLFSSLVPSFLRGILGVRNLAVIGAVSFLLFAVAAISQALSARLPARRSVSLGLPVLLAGLAALGDPCSPGRCGCSWPAPSSAASRSAWCSAAA
jgi:hypothetical protein